MDTYSIVEQLLTILSLAMPAIFYGYKLYREIRKNHTKGKSEPSVSTRLAHLHELDVDISIHVKSK